MQKKIIALAIAGALAAPALAFADPAVNVYGVLDAWVGDVTASGTKSQMLVASGGLSQSRLGVKAMEDLGNGTKVMGVLEYGVDGTDASGLGGTVARQKLLGLTGGWGTVAAGYLQTAGYDWATKYDPAADSSISALQNITGSASANTGFLIGNMAIVARAQRALAYLSPDFSGFNFAVNYSTALGGAGDLGLPSSASSASNALLLSGNYGMGPWSVGLVYAAADNLPQPTIVTPNPVPQFNETEWALGGSYDFTVTKVSATYQATKMNIGPGSSNKAYSISDLTPVGPGSLLLQYAGSSIDNQFGTGAALSSANGSSYTVGYLYSLSKMTTAYVAYSGVKNGDHSNAFSVDNGAVGGAASSQSLGATSSLVAVGVNYKF
ncbi:MAG: porin [Gallionella sp.]